jgi:Spy/CpxP family protein refolding chaperone
MKTMNLIAFTVLAVSGAASAQHHPYAGQQDRQIKALSGAEVDQYLAGAGAGYAKAAELNHYPGPTHVLELADKLGLSEAQRISVKQLMQTHNADAKALGLKRVAAERRLDELFKSGKADEASLAESVRTAASLEGEYRLSHLETHRRLRPLLTEEQIRRYDELRGYAGTGHSRELR